MLTLAVYPLDLRLQSVSAMRGERNLQTVTRSATARFVAVARVLGEARYREIDGVARRIAKVDWLANHSIGAAHDVYRRLHIAQLLGLERLLPGQRKPREAGESQR